MKGKKEIKIGIIVTLILLLFLWGYNFLKGRNLFSSYNYYYAIFQDIGGLQKSSPVSVSGYSVGIVSDINFSSEAMDKLIVELGIRKDFKLPVNSVVYIASDIIGTRTVTVEPGNSNDIAENGDTLLSGSAPGMLSSLMGDLGPTISELPVLKKFENLMDSILNILQYTFDADTRDNIKGVISGLDGMVASESKKISGILSNFESVSGNLQKSNEDISNMIAQLSKFSGTLSDVDLKAAVDNANNSLSQLNGLLTGIKEGQGTIGKLATNDSVYMYLQHSLHDLDKLLIDLREHPRDYVHFSLFGGKKK
jgi:phospholipid/cholesterol/gamma-HCH transport system substrate-binding protein